MASLTVRNIDSGSLAGFAEYAKRKNKSVAAEVRDIISERGQAVRVEKLMARIKKRREEIYAQHGPMEDSISQIRAIRDEE
jgi:plasmid stability protein